MGNEFTESQYTDDLECKPGNGKRYSPLNGYGEENFKEDEFFLFEEGDKVWVDVPSNDNKKDIRKICNTSNLVKLLGACQGVKLILVLRADNMSGRNEQLRNSQDYYELLIKSQHNEDKKEVRKKSLLLFNITPASQ